MWASFWTRLPCAACHKYALDQNIWAGFSWTLSLLWPFHAERCHLSSEIASHWSTCFIKTSLFNCAHDSPFPYAFRNSSFRYISYQFGFFLWAAFCRSPVQTKIFRTRMSFIPVPISSHFSELELFSVLYAFNSSHFSRPNRLLCHCSIPLTSSSESIFEHNYNKYSRLPRIVISQGQNWNR